MNFIEMIELDQESLIKQSKGAENFAHFKSVDGIALNPDGISIAKAKRILEKEKSFIKEWRQFQANSKKVILQKDLWYAAMKQTKRLMPIVMGKEDGIAKLTLPISKEKYQLLISTEKMPTYKQVAMQYLGSTVSPLFGVLFLISMVIAFCLGAYIWGGVFAVSSALIALYIYRGISESIDTLEFTKYEKKNLEETYLEKKNLPFAGYYFSGPSVIIPTKIIFASWQNPSSKEELNRLIRESLTYNNGKLIYFVDMNRSMVTFKLKEDTLYIHGEVMVGIQTENLIIFDRESNGASTSFAAQASDVPLLEELFTKQGISLLDSQ